MATTSVYVGEGGARVGEGPARARLCGRPWRGRLAVGIYIHNHNGTKGVLEPAGRSVKLGVADTVPDARPGRRGRSREADATAAVDPG